MYKPELRQRLDALFADIERLATNPAGNTYSVRLELDELRTRLHDLEAEIAIFERVVAPPEPARPSIVEPAFAEGGDTARSPLTRRMDWMHLQEMKYNLSAVRWKRSQRPLSL
jgi:hypothetical protein